MRSAVHSTNGSGGRKPACGCHYYVAPSGLSPAATIVFARRYNDPLNPFTSDFTVAGRGSPAALVVVQSVKVIPSMCRRK